MAVNWNMLGISPANILLPEEKVSPSTWAVVACDQYTAEPEYWETVDQIVGTNPSALRIVLPEVYLEKSDTRVPAIHEAMNRYLAEGLLETAVSEGFVLTERNTQSGARLGLVAAVDLEAYDYGEGTHSLIRPTEGTIVSRIPPRLAVRRSAALECPHVMLLIDDVMESVIEPLYKERSRLPVLYDFPLMMKGGHLKGWAVSDPALLSMVHDALSTLLQRLPGEHPLLYAVGDGNHSLATAKAYWEEIKKTLPKDKAAQHPARYALAEIENIHDDALAFEPIHRILFNVEGASLMRDWTLYCHQRGMDLCEDDSLGKEQTIGVVFGGMDFPAVVTGSSHPLAVGTLQAFLDHWLIQHPEAEIDYIHGDDTLRRLAERPGSVGFLLPALHKDALLPAIEKNGALPRKTFSMGEANEKRYYMECRRLTL